VGLLGTLPGQSLRMHFNLFLSMGEQSYRDRQARAELLRNMVAGFGVPFNPPDATLNVAGFTTFLASIDTANNQVDVQEASYTTSATERSQLVISIKKRATQMVGRLKSNGAWAGEYASAKQTADKLRGKTPPKPKPPTDVPTPDHTKTRNTGDQAYAEVAALLEKLVTTATGAAAWATGVPTELSAATLAALVTELTSLNTSLSTLDASLTTNREKRKLLYFGPKGLQEKFQFVKDSVKGQYGQSSPEYASVKGIRW